MLSALWKVGLLPSTSAGDFVEPFTVTQVSLLQQQREGKCQITDLMNGWQSPEAAQGTLPSDHLACDLFTDLIIVSAPLPRKLQADRDLALFTPILYPSPRPSQSCWSQWFRRLRRETGHLGKDFPQSNDIHRTFHAFGI